MKTSYLGLTSDSFMENYNKLLMEYYKDRIMILHADKQKVIHTLPFAPEFYVEIKYGSTKVTIGETLNEEKTEIQDGTVCFSKNNRYTIYTFLILKQNSISLYLKDSRDLYGGTSFTSFANTPKGPICINLCESASNANDLKSFVLRTKEEISPITFGNTLINKNNKVMTQPFYHANEHSEVYAPMGIFNISFKSPGELFSPKAFISKENLQSKYNNERVSTSIVIPEESIAFEDIILEKPEKPPVKGSENVNLKEYTNHEIVELDPELIKVYFPDRERPPFLPENIHWSEGDPKVFYSQELTEENKLYTIRLPETVTGVKKGEEVTIVPQHLADFFHIVDENGGLTPNLPNNSSVQIISEHDIVTLPTIPHNVTHMDVIDYSNISSAKYASFGEAMSNEHSKNGIVPLNLKLLRLPQFGEGEPPEYLEAEEDSGLGSLSGYIPYPNFHTSIELQSNVLDKKSPYPKIGEVQLTGHLYLGSGSGFSSMKIEKLNNFGKYKIFSYERSFDGRVVMRYKGVFLSSYIKTLDCSTLFAANPVMGERVFKFFKTESPVDLYVYGIDNHLQTILNDLTDRHEREAPEFWIRPISEGSSEYVIENFWGLDAPSLHISPEVLLSGYIVYSTSREFKPHLRPLAELVKGPLKSTLITTSPAPKVQI